jgi:serine/threonine protein kinase
LKAPEVLEGKDYGIEADMFSLGAVIYMLLTGEKPFDDN